MHKILTQAHSLFEGIECLVRTTWLIFFFFLTLISGTMAESISGSSFSSSWFMGSEYLSY